MSEGFSGDPDRLLTGFAIGSRIAGYRLEERIGAGGMAVVFKAVDERLNRRVALKAIAPALAADDEFRRRFIHESRAAAAVDDPHIIPVYEAGEAGGVLFIAMRFVPGGDVRELMRREGALPPDRATAIISAVASALDAAHAAGLIHRDVKPANMLLDSRPDRPDHVYLSDFGLSKGALSSAGLTGTGVFLGTLDYCSPEQIEGKSVDARADQYSLACSAFELLAGLPPFVREQLPAVIWAHMSEPPPALSARRPELGEAADIVFARALAKAPQNRYPSCAEFASALRSALGVAPYHRVGGPNQAPAVDRAGGGAGSGAGTDGATVDHPATEAVRLVPEVLQPAPQAPVPVQPATSAVADLAPDIEPTQVRAAAWQVGPVRTSPVRTSPVPDTAATAGVEPPHEAYLPSARKPGRGRWIAVAAAAASMALVAGLVAALGHGGGGGHAAGSVSVRPVYGGTLRLVSSYTPDQLDPADAYSTGDYALERAYTRQLVTFPAAADYSVHSPGWTADTTVVPDVATAVPTVANGGISNGGLTFTFHIKRGVMWNTSPPRQVTAQDFVRAFKAMCNPALATPTEQYYSATIRGMGVYCGVEYAHFLSGPRTAADVARFQDTNAIAGITALGPLTLRFDLVHPATDFLDLLALTFTSARPAEYDAYLPGSIQLQQHLLSDGPYQVASYAPGKSLTLTQNPVWRLSTDAVRHRFVARITDVIGVPSAAALVAGEQSGQHDLSLDTFPPGSDMARFRASHDPKFAIWPSGFLTYLVLNLRSPNSGHAMRKLVVRQAIEYGVGKAAVRASLGSSAAFAQVANSVITPGNVGYRDFALYPSPGDQGDAAKCRSLLRRAGYSSGLTLNYWYSSEDSVNGLVFGAVRQSLRGCGITVVGKAISPSAFYTDLDKTSDTGKPGTFDLAATVWFPDWFGDNARSTIGYILQSNCSAGTVNFGCFDSPAMDNLISQAESAPTIAQAAVLWHQADVLAMRDAAIVPLYNQGQPFYSSARVHQYCPPGASCPTAIIWQPNVGGPDITNVWLSGH